MSGEDLIEPDMSFDCSTKTPTDRYLETASDRGDVHVSTEKAVVASRLSEIGEKRLLLKSLRSKITAPPQA